VFRILSVEARGITKTDKTTPAKKSKIQKQTL